jgi:hypothetical protein
LFAKWIALREQYSLHRKEKEEYLCHGKPVWRSSHGVAPFELLVGKEESNQCQDDSPDGDEDLTLKFDTQDIVAVLGDVTDGDVVTLTLTEKLKEGTDLKGTAIKSEDIVKILKKEKDNIGKK